MLKYKMNLICLENKKNNKNKKDQNIYKKLKINQHQLMEDMKE